MWARWQRGKSASRKTLSLIHIYLPTVGLDVDFVALGETEEYKKYADLEAVHLYDTVRVIAKSAGIDAAVRVTGYKWDALGRKYESVTLGEITDLKTTVYGYQLSNHGIKTRCV